MERLSVRGEDGRVNMRITQEVDEERQVVVVKEYPAKGFREGIKYFRAAFASKTKVFCS